MALLDTLVSSASILECDNSIVDPQVILRVCCKIRECPDGGVATHISVSIPTTQRCDELVASYDVTQCNDDCSKACAETLGLSPIPTDLSVVSG